MLRGYHDAVLDKACGEHPGGDFGPIVAIELCTLARQLATRLSVCQALPARGTRPGPGVCSRLPEPPWLFTCGDAAHCGIAPVKTPPAWPLLEWGLGAHRRAHPTKKDRTMRMAIAVITLASAALGLSSAGCSADIHDNTADVHDNTANIDDAKVEMSTTADANNVQPGQALPVVVAAQDVFLISPSATPPADQTAVAGHLQIYFDDMSSDPLLITASESFSVTIPATATVGDHKVICRVHKHDGTPTSATFELDVKVTAKVSASG